MISSERTKVPTEPSAAQPRTSDATSDGPDTHRNGRQRAAWRQQLVDAESGFRLGLRADSTLFVHFFLGSVIIGSATVLGLSGVEWAMVILVIGITLSTELFNQLLKQIMVVVSPNMNHQLEDIFRMATTAVVITYVTSGAVLTVLFWPHVMQFVRH